MTKRSVISYLLSIIMLALLTTTPTLGQAESTTTNTQTDIVTNIGSSCIGELIQVTGNMHVMMRTLVRPDGSTSRSFHINLQAQGQGVDTGATYQFGQTTQQVFNRPDLSPLEFILAETVRITSNGPDNNFRVRTLIHVTINANGEVTAQLNNIDRVCD